MAKSLSSSLAILINLAGPLEIIITIYLFYLFIYLFEHSLFKQRHSLKAVRSYNNTFK